MRLAITLTSSLHVDQRYLDLTKKIAQYCAQQNYGIVYGGTEYGMMKVLAETYKDAGGTDLVGVLAEDLMAVTKGYKAFDDLDEVHVCKTIEERKRTILDLADAFLILPGGFGTFEEIGSIVGAKANKLINKAILIWNGGGFYDQLISFFDQLHQEQFTKIAFTELCTTITAVDTIASQLSAYQTKELSDKFISS